MREPIQGIVTARAQPHSCFQRPRSHVRSRDRVSDLVPDFGSVLPSEKPAKPLSDEQQLDAWRRTMEFMFPG